MPIIETLMNALTARYGRAEGERVYYAMEGEAKGPFGPNGKYHDLHVEWAMRNGVLPIEGTGKPRAQKDPGLPRRR